MFVTNRYTNPMMFLGHLQERRPELSECFQKIFKSYDSDVVPEKYISARQELSSMYISLLVDLKGLDE